jgi:hypothetical protein
VSTAGGVDIIMNSPHNGGMKLSIWSVQAVRTWHEAGDVVHAAAGRIAAYPK